MDITVNSTLIRSRNPNELNLKIEGQKGKVIHSLDDGWWLIEFPTLLTKSIVTVSNSKKKIMQFTPLQWYVFKDDLTIM